ncbi:MAG TPA: phosphatase PAP2 family protein [Gemmatimonadales bacterium]|nr:phosphatase PAP2 family protein [Gemmatimonadales bacterium]
MARFRVAVIMAGLAIGAQARADGLLAGPTDRVALDVPADIAITAVGTIGAVVPLIFSDQLVPDRCRWCDGPVGTPVNAVDDWFHAHLTGWLLSVNTANSLSSVLAYAVTPAVAFGSTYFATGPHATDGAGWRNVMIVAESVAVAAAITENIKWIAARQRPYEHYQNFANGAGAASSEVNTSFPSGHTFLPASAGTSAAMLATLEDSSAAPWLWATTGVMTVATGTLRMMSEAHYFTDVVGGAAIGVGCGVLFPLLHRRGAALAGSASPVIAATQGGAIFSLGGAF